MRLVLDRRDTMSKNKVRKITVGRPLGQQLLKDGQIQMLPSLQKSYPVIQPGHQVLVVWDKVEVSAVVEEKQGDWFLEKCEHAATD